MRFRTLLLGVSLLASTISAYAQNSYVSYENEFIPNSFTKDGISKLEVVTGGYYSDDTNPMSVSVYNDSFEEVASGIMKSEIYISNLCKQREEVFVKVHEFDRFFDELYIPSNILKSFLEGKYEGWTSEMIYEHFSENEYCGDIATWFSDSIMKAQWLEASKNEYTDLEFFFGDQYEDYRQVKAIYPIVFHDEVENLPTDRLFYKFIHPTSNEEYIGCGIAHHYISKRSTYTGEWVVVYESKTKIRPTSIGFVDLYNGVASEYIDLTYLTQTLFNDDDKYEYLYPNYTLEESSEENDRDGDGIVDKIITRRDEKLSSYDVLNLDGEKVGTIPIKGTYYDSDDLHLYKWNNKYYFCYYDEMENEEGEEVGYDCYYQFTPKTTEIKKIDAPVMFRMMPQVAKRNETVEIEIAEEAIENGGEIVVTDMSGRKVYTRTVRNGEKTLHMPVNRLSSGVYGVSFITKGKKIESSKLIVR